MHIINKQINEVMEWMWRGWGLYQMWEGALQLCFKFKLFGQLQEKRVVDTSTAWKWS